MDYIIASNFNLALKYSIMKPWITMMLTAVLLWSASGCKKDEGLNLFSISDEIEFGQQLEAEIAANPAEYPVLDSAQFNEAYGHIYRMRNDILNSGNVKYKNEFPWRIKIIHSDSVLNAFCAPGGFIYVYTGLIHFLDTEDELAGVLGHEIAHADKRHATEQLTKNYGFAVLLQVLLGNNQSLLTEIAQGLLSLRFSRANETEADDYSVKYLCPTDYNAAGAAGFFQKLLDLEQVGSTPQFLSTHPSPDNRVQNINTQKVDEGCTGTGTFVTRYQQLKNSLP